MFKSTNGIGLSPLSHILTTQGFTSSNNKTLNARRVHKFVTGATILQLGFTSFSADILHACQLLNAFFLFMK